MFIILTILAELIFVAGLIIWFYRLKPRFGLVPLFVLIGSNQFFQTILATTFYVKVFGEYTISPGATILFCSSLFTVLLVYIKEGVFITQRLILGIVLANLTFTFLSWLTNQQSLAMKGSDLLMTDPSYIFKTNTRVFIVGTMVLLLDTLIIVILYEYFFVKQKWLNLYSRLLLTMLLVLNFDAVMFTLGCFWDKPGLDNRLISQMVAKSVAAVFFATILWFYLRYLDKDKKILKSQVVYGKEDIFSILTYRSKYERLITEKAISEEQLQKAIAAKTEVLEQQILARKQAEQNIIHEKELSDSLINSLPGVFYLYNEQGKFFRWNKNFETVTGFNSVEMLSKHPLDFFDGEEVEVLTKKIQNVFITGEDNVTANFVNRQGGKTPYFFTGKMINYEGERCLMGVGIDISERVKMEERLITSEERFRTLVQQASDGIFIANKDFEYIMVNDSGCKMLGYSEDELRKIQLHELTMVSKEDTPFRFAELDEGKSVLQERILRHKDGHAIPVEISAKRLFNGNLLAIVRNISDRKRSQEVLKKSEQNLRQVLSSITDIFYVVDINYQITLMNKTAKEMLSAGWNKEVSVGDNILNLLPANSDEPVKESFDKVFNGISVEYEHYHQSEKINGWFLVNYHPVINDEQNITGAYVVTKEITEIKKAEEQLNSYNEQLRDLTAHLLSIREEERRRIGREIHDDLGQQLTAIKMDVAWIDKKIDGEENKQVKDKLKNIIGLLDGSNQSVRRILNELKPSILDEYGLMDALEWQAKQFTESTGVQVTIDTNEADFKLAEDIATCIFRVVQESLTNIARHSAAKNVIISLSLNEQMIQVKVQDDGNGFNASRANDKGTFGLLGMKERARSLKGKFTIHSTPGWGTIISLSLPNRTS